MQWDQFGEGHFFFFDTACSQWHVFNFHTFSTVGLGVCCGRFPYSGLSEFLFLYLPWGPSAHG